MGQQKQGAYNLVVMTNGDVYYLSDSEVKHLTNTLNLRGGAEYHQALDAKSGAVVILALANVSSVVMKGGQDVSR